MVCGTFALSQLPIRITSHEAMVLYLLSSGVLNINDIMRYTASIGRTLSSSYLMDNTLPSLERLGLITIDRSGKAFVISITVSGVNLLNQLERVLSTIRLDR
jgi:DNA-binding HxlR family transcriptional regulator